MALVPGSYVVVVRVGFIKIRTRFKKRQKKMFSFYGMTRLGVTLTGQVSRATKP